mgnify:CR=1 FL=1
MKVRHNRIISNTIKYVFFPLRTLRCGGHLPLLHALRIFLLEKDFEGKHQKLQIQLHKVIWDPQKRGV